MNEKGNAVKKRKRIVTKLGDVFCCEIEGRGKRFFQYFCIDSSCMNSSVIRVFKTVYPMDYKPDVERIVEDEVEFYTHTILRVGIELGICYKVGKSKNIDDPKFATIPFLLMEDNNGYLQPFGTTSLENFTYRIWYANGEIIRYDYAHMKYIPGMEFGAICPLTSIARRMKTGYFNNSSEEYIFAKRKPYPAVESFTRVVSEGRSTYYRFLGEDMIEVLEKYGEDEYVFAVKNGIPELSGFEMFKFGDRNWAFADFITKEEYLEFRKQFE